MSKTVQCVVSPGSFQSPLTNSSLTLPTTFGGGGTFPSGTYYLVFRAVSAGGTSLGSASFIVGSPDISLQSPVGTNLNNGTSTVAFGDTSVGRTLSATFAILNPGNSTLSNISAVIGGANAGDFTITLSPPMSIAAGGSSTFRVQFAPTATGARSAKLSISCNVTGGKNPFVVNLSGSGDAAPSATTLAPTNITEDSAVLNGTVNANGASTATTFEYGPTTSYGTQVSGVPSVVTGTTLTPVSLTTTD